MSKKTLNKANLAQLGADQLADLVLDLVQGDAALQRRARLVLSAAQGPKEVASDIRRRFSSLRRATRFVDWHKQRALVQDLDGLLEAIDTSISPSDPNLAFELLWQFLELAPSVYERTDDSNGSIGGVMCEAVRLISKISGNVSVNKADLADQILSAVADAGYGEFDGIIPATAEALGEEGLEHLKASTNTWAALPPTSAEIERYKSYGFYGSGETAEDSIKRSKDLTRSILLADIADAQGDVDAYMARYTAEQLTYHTIAPDVAQRLMAADRTDEAYKIICVAREKSNDQSYISVHSQLDDTYERCLKEMGLMSELKAHLWERFETYLHEESLKQYLKLMEDFDDIEAEERALQYAENYPQLETAVGFLVKWPAFEVADRVIQKRHHKLNGNLYGTLNTVAQALDADFPVSASLVRRAMIIDTLEGAKSKRYKHAARHLAECRASDFSIKEYGYIMSHEAFLQKIKQDHGRKTSFWNAVDRH